MKKNKAFMIYIDFDDTLYDHTFHWRFDEDFEYNMLFGFGKIPYDKKFLNHELIEKVRQICAYLHKNGIKPIVNLLTGCQTSIYFKSKTDLLDDAVPGLFDNYFSVSTQDAKIQMIQAYNKEVETDYNIVKTLVIDDGFGVTAQCQDLGFDAIAPGYFEKHYKVEIQEKKWKRLR